MDPTTPVILLTRPKHQSDRFAISVSQKFGNKISVKVAPMLEIMPVTTNISIEQYDALVFTSENAVLTMELPNSLRGCQAYCVGPRTATAAKKIGLNSRAADGNADSLIFMIRQLRTPGRLIHLRGRHTRGNIAAKLLGAGIPCDESIVYEQLELPMSETARKLLQGDRAVILPLFSPRSAKILSQAIGEITAPVHVIAFSPDTAAEIDRNDVANLTICKRPDAENMLAEIELLLAA